SKNFEELLDFENECESENMETNNQQKTGRNNKKCSKNSKKLDLNKIADQLILISNVKPPGQSWIWGYFDQYEPTEQYKRIVRCLVQVQWKNGVESYEYFMGSDSSTDEIIRNNPDIKNRQNRKFVRILIKDNQLISLGNNEGFIEFVYELDPNYQFPSDKTIQQLLAESYNQIKDNLENNYEYLQMIANVETRWNSSYLAWKRLIKIKDLIDILASTMMIDPDSSTRRDGKRLKNINLTEAEWQEISKLIIILEDFAGATEILGGKKYTTISLMYSILAVINQKLIPDDKSYVEIIDLTSLNIAFNDDVGYEDALEDEPITEQPKRRKININIPQDCNNLTNRIKMALYKSMNHY
ncbi:6450_t:CDS:2, partial [Funneliformis caledonium]